MTSKLGPNYKRNLLDILIYIMINLNSFLFYMDISKAFKVRSEEKAREQINLKDIKTF